MPIVLICIQSTLLVGIALKQSVTFDETGHLAAGLAHWKHGDFSLYAVNPPLPRLVATLPALPLAANFEFPAFNAFPERREELRLGILLSTQVDNYHFFSVIARLALLPFCCLGGFVCYAWAKELYGLKAGFLALLLLCFSPNIQANASQVLPDLAVSSLFVTTCFLLRKRSPRDVKDSPVIAGLLLGVALLCKFTAVLLVPVAIAIVCWRAARSEGKPILFRLVRGIGKAATICSVSILVVNVGYFFEDTMLPLGQFEFLSESFSGIARSENMKGNRFLRAWNAEIPVPIPRNFLLGIDLAKYELERGYWSYLNGEFSTTGWWYFYLYGLAVKEPVGLFGLLLIAGTSLVCCAAKREYRADEILLVGIPVILLAVLSSATGYTHHVRYALPTLPFAYILAARSVANPWLMKAQWAWVFLFIGSSLLCYPHQISYFNELAGGPINGWKHPSVPTYVRQLECRFTSGGHGVLSWPK